ncbi:MAG: hypothetical protein HDT27_01985 [Subdoligranulum sp.]|nr:hypothetical protein [Subdoligranulum sp.]
MKRIANCAALAGLVFLAWRVAALEQREHDLLRALRLTERNVELLATIEKDFSIEIGL